MTASDRLREATEPRDPTLRRIAERLGDDVARGKIDLDAAFTLLGTAAGGAVPNYDLIRACWHCRDAAHATGTALRRAERDLRRAVRPLLAARVRRAEIEEAAGPFAKVMGWPAVFDLLTGEAEASRRAQRWAGGRVA